MKPRNRGLFHRVKLKGECECGYRGPTERHHVEGRKHSNLVIEICPNCHRQIHKGGGLGFLGLGRTVEG